jgi:diacylglycerol kinase
MTEGFRGDSTFFVHFFGGSVALAAAAVLGVPLLHACLIVLCLAAVLTAELFHRALVAGFEALAHSNRLPAELVRKTRRISTAAVTVTTIAALLTVALVIGLRLWRTFSG